VEAARYWLSAEDVTKVRELLGMSEEQPA